MCLLSHMLLRSPSRSACTSRWSCPASNRTTCAGVATQTWGGGARSQRMTKDKCSSSKRSREPRQGKRVGEPSLESEAVKEESASVVSEWCCSPPVCCCWLRIPRALSARGRRLFAGWGQSGSTRRFRRCRGRRLPAGPVSRRPMISALHADGRCLNRRGASGAPAASWAFTPAPARLIRHLALAEWAAPPPCCRSTWLLPKALGDEHSEDLLDVV
mmetsp:Transcript_119945/g.373553  ORF Transcript_119945/g.373553 Transcript_119945/m.373553 type:complete len:216 (+) Transcript_119945:566-1213(+)